MGDSGISVMTEKKYMFVPYAIRFTVTVLWTSPQCQLRHLENSTRALQGSWYKVIPIQIVSNIIKYWIN